MERIGSFMVSHPWLITIPLAMGAAISLGFGIFNFLNAQELGERVTIIERSPCELAPHGRECQTLFRDSIRAFNPATVCVLDRKLGIPCPPSFRP